MAFTVGEVLRRARDALRDADIDGAALDARLLVAASLAIDPSRLPLESDRAVSDADLARAMALIDRRARREPVGRILGTREFWGLSFRLSPETLEPRPDTETLIEAVLSWLDAAGRRHDRLSIADIGTGSGAILVALLSECPQALGIGTDLSQAALQTARDNAARAGVGDRALFARMDHGDALGGGLDLVLSNPPYIRHDDLAGLAPEVRWFDPRLALDGGPDGLRSYRHIAATVGATLRPGGMVMVEVGADQAGDVEEIFRATGFEFAFRRRDLGGHDRVVAMQHHVV